MSKYVDIDGTIFELVGVNEDGTAVARPLDRFLTCDTCRLLWHADELGACGAGAFCPSCWADNAKTCDCGEHA